MRTDFLEFVRAQVTPPPPDSIADWAEANIDFSLAPNYDTPAHAPFMASFAPYMKGILDKLQDHSTREIWIRKCSRAAATEYLLAWLRWIIKVKPAPTYYLTADQLTTERFMESRIKRGMSTCPSVLPIYKRARVTEHDIRFEHMDFRVSWPNAKGAFKQDGWANIIADEFPTWKAFAPDMLRKRAGTYAFHKVVGLGSPDPTRKGADADPIIAEYESTDRCTWQMEDPETGNLFAWDFGGVGKSYGLKWPADAQDPETKEWDLERVRNEAYYLTPDGTRIDNTDRLTIGAAGSWVSTNPNAPKHIHGIWIVGPMVPFLDGDFGVLAYRFLEAKRKGAAALRAYFFENWADVGDMPNSQSSNDNSLRARVIDYGKGEPFYKSPDVSIPDECSKGLALTVDVQKYHLWYVARQWAHTGDRCESGLEQWGNLANFDDLAALADTIQPQVMGIDIGYAERFGEVADFCSQQGAIALKGEENMKGDLYLRDDMDPAEGRKSRQRNGLSYSMLTWNTDVFRSKLLSAIDGESAFEWYVYRMIERQYVRQVLSTHKVDGEWSRKKGHPDDHLFDCEVMQMVLARFGGLIQ